VGAGALRGSGLYNACIVGRVVLGHWSSSTNAAFALPPLCVAREFQWCDHVYPRWGGHNIVCVARVPVLGSPASLIGSELSRNGAPALRFAPVLCCRVFLMYPLVPYSAACT
jgi:hypothetical protein